MNSIHTALKTSLARMEMNSAHTAPRTNFQRWGRASTEARLMRMNKHDLYRSMGRSDMRMCDCRRCLPNDA